MLEINGAGRGISEYRGRCCPLQRWVVSQEPRLWSLNTSSPGLLREMADSRTRVGKTQHEPGTSCGAKSKERLKVCCGNVGRTQKPA